MLLHHLALVTSLAVTGHAIPRNIARQAGAQSFASNANGSLKLAQQDAPVSGSGNANGASTWSLTFDDTSSGHQQSITGFGGAVTDATVQTFNSLPVDQRAQLLKDLMSSDGANFSLMRNTIASSDLSPNVYTYDDSNGQADTSFINFNLGDSGNAMAKLIVDMKDVQGNLTLLSSSWSPPGWMKLNGVTSGSTQNNNLNPDYRGALAQYFVKYIQSFEAQGVSIDALTIQNEPLNSQSGYPTMYVFADESAQIIQENVGPALAAAGLKTKVWAYDHNTDVPDYPQTVLDKASQYVDTVAWHCYAPNVNWGALTDFHNANPGVTQYMTECWTSPQTGPFQAADFTMGPLQNWASGAIAWTLGSTTEYQPHLDGGCSTCRGLVTVAPDGSSYSLTTDYYMLAQFSKFMPRGATVLAGTGSYDYGNGSKVEATASLNADGSRTVVIQNGFTNDLYVTVSMKSGDQWSGNVPASSVTTWVLPAN